MKRSSRGVLWRPPFVWWIEIPVWILFFALTALWLNHYVPWWYALVFPPAVELLLLASWALARFMRRRRLLRQYPALRGGV